MLSLAQWAAATQQQQQQAEQAGSVGGAAGGKQAAGAHGRKRERERDWDKDEDPSTPSHLRGINRALIGTKACVFWASGKCAKGDKCTFRHD